MEGWFLILKSYLGTVYCSCCSHGLFSSLSQDSQNDIFLQLVGVCLLVPKDWLLEILYFLYGNYSIFFMCVPFYASHFGVNNCNTLIHLSRNEKNQLLLGIRRATRPQTVMPSSVLSSDSMHIGLLAAAAHAAATNSCFTVFYNPRFENILSFATVTAVL